MAIAEMKKLLLVGNNRERGKLIDTLHGFGCAEIVFSARYERTDPAQEPTAKDAFLQKIAQVEFCFAVFKNYRSEAVKLTKEKKLNYRPFRADGLLTAKPSLSFEEFCKTPEQEGEIFDAAERIGAWNEEIIRIRAESVKLQNQIDQAKPFAAITQPLSLFLSTKTADVALGSVAVSKLGKLEALEEAGACWEVFPAGAYAAVAVVSLKEDADRIQNVLSAAEFVPYAQRSELSAADLIAEYRQKKAELLERRIQLIGSIMELETLTPRLRRIHDYYTLEARKCDCETMTSQTQSSYVLEAWVPALAEENVQKALDESEMSLAFVMRDPQEGEIPPTLTVNNGVVAPYESVTNMFSAPDYKEIDPNPFVTFFFFLFFGMMVSDAGYGLLLTIATGIVLAVTHPPKGHSNLIKIIFMGGISTLLWGMVFGSYFGFSAKDIGLPYWFNPIEDPMMMLYLSLGMGLFQMCFGLGINMVSLWRQHKPLQGFCAAFSWYFLILGIAAGALGGKLAPWLPTVGWCVLGVGLALLMLAGALDKKGAKKVTGAFGSLYGIINFFSDLMSYTRIFGLGLATAVIGMVFNQIGQVIYGLIPVKFIGAIAFGVIFLIGHIFNVGINTLGAYVHNSRLQFVEFFGKFYTGGGRLFRPLGSEMRYYYIAEKPARQTTETQRDNADTSGVSKEIQSQ